MVLDDQDDGARPAPRPAQGRPAARGAAWSRAPELQDLVRDGRGWDLPGPAADDGAGRGGQRQADDEQRPALRRVRDRDLAALEAGQLADDRKTQAGPAERPVRAALQLAEALEHHLAMLFRDARASVGDLDHRLARLPVGPDRAPHGAGPGAPP